MIENRRERPLVSLAPITWLTAAIALLSLLVHSAQVLLAPIGHDQTWLLLAAQRVVDGFQIDGPHLIETNPPFFIWLSTIPVLLARVLHTTPALLFKLLVIAAVIASVLWCVRILARAAVFNAVSIGLLACALVEIDFSIGPYDFGQREHLLFLLMIPYILAAATGAVTRFSVFERCLIGVCAALAIWLKPYDIIILIVLELFLALRSRSLRRLLAPELLSLVAASTLLLLLLLTAAPLYTKQVLPLLLDSYWAFGSAGTIALALSSRTYPFFVLCALVAYAVLRRRLRDHTTALVLVLLSLAASFAFDVQHTTWEYHRFPHRALILTALAWIAVDAFNPVFDKLVASPRLTRVTVIAAMGSIAFAVAFTAVHRRTLFNTPKTTSYRELDSFLTHYRPSTPVYVFSTGVGPMAVVSNNNLIWGSRFAHLWMLPAIIQNEQGPTGPPVPYKPLSKDRLAALAALQRSQSAEDLNYWRPAVVLVEQCTLQDPCQGIEKKNFDMLAWFLRSPQFAAEWSHYQRSPEAPNHFDLYTRVQ